MKWVLLASLFVRIVSDHLESDDWVFPYYRDKELAERFPSCKRSAVVGAQYLKAVGLAHGFQLQGLNRVVYVSGGDGSTAQGDFYEALNYASIHKLPVVFVIYDDGWSFGVPTPSSGPIEELAGGRPNLSVERAEPREFEGLFARAVARARLGGGPSLIVIDLCPEVVFLGQNVTGSPGFNTPLAESTIVGVAIGLALDGFHRPVAEIQDGKFLLLAMHQIAEIDRLHPDLPIVIHVQTDEPERYAELLRPFKNIQVVVGNLQDRLSVSGPVIVLHRSVQSEASSLSAL